MEKGAFLSLTCCLGLQSPRLICCESPTSIHVAFSEATCDDIYEQEKKIEVLPNFENSCSDEACWADFVLKCWWFTVYRSPVCLHLVGGDCGRTGFSFCRGLGRAKVWGRLRCWLCLWECGKDRKWEERNCDKKRDTVTVSSDHISTSGFLHQYFKRLFSIIHHLDWVSHPPCIVLSQANPSDSCVKGGTRLSGRKPLRCREEESWSEKVYPVESGVPGPQGEPCTSPWECMHFHVSPSLRWEYITSTMGLQMAVPATHVCRH